MKRATFGEIKDNYKVFMEGWKNEHHRFRSYDPCKEYFDKFYGKTLTTEEKEEFSLRLFAYLASWGMFRGNDWFIWKSSRVFLQVTDVLFDVKYKQLKDIDPYSENFDVGKYCNLTIELQTAVYNILKATLEQDDKLYPPKSEKENKVSPLMVCKILMGTYGCVIAYDSYDMKGLRALGVKAPQNQDMRTLLENTCNIFTQNKNVFTDIMQDMKQYDVNYTAFKVLDMILWIYGEKN